MLSDACFDVAHEITKAAVAALDAFEEAIDNYDDEIYGYPSEIITVLRLVASDLRDEKLTVSQFFDVVDAVRSFHDAPGTSTLDVLMTRIKSVLERNRRGALDAATSSSSLLFLLRHGKP